METNDADHVKGSNMEAKNKDPTAGNNKERKKKDHKTRTNKKIKMEDQTGGSHKGKKKDDPEEESYLVTSEENLEERSNMNINKDHPMSAKSDNIHDEVLKEEPRKVMKKEDHEVDDPLLYADCSQGILISAERLRKFKDYRYAQLFTSSQRRVFDEVLKAVESGRGGCFFVEARPQRMKLDLLNAILAAVRIGEDESKCSTAVDGDSALATSSLQLASHLLLGGRTFHYMFNASLNVTEDPELQITKGSILADIICRAKVIVVDEAVCLNKLHIEQLDDKLREITKSEKDFGGKVIVLAGDFRKLLPFDKKKTKDERELAINQSHLWSKFKVFTLRAREEDSSDRGLDQFDEWLQRLGNGDERIVTAPGLGYSKDYIKLPEDMCMELKNRKESLHGLIQFVFPSFEQNTYNCAILAPTNKLVHEINDECMNQMSGKSETFRSEDTITECTCQSVTSETCPCSKEMFDLPPHLLELKIGVPLILLTTLQTEELHTGTQLTISTGTRLTLKKFCGEHLQCTVAGGRVVNIEKETLRTVLSQKGQWDGKGRHQFPVLVAFAMTIHKSQGVMLTRAGVWLEKDVFTHGQLYAAASCVERRDDIRFVLPKRGVPPCYATRNIVNKQVFQAAVPAPPT